MTIPSDKILAQRTLHVKKHGYTLGYFLKLNRMPYILALGVMLSLLFLLKSGLYQRGIWCLIGVFIGSMLRDFVWFVAIRAMRPYSNLITDWAKVEAIAATVDSTSPPAGIIEEDDGLTPEERFNKENNDAS